MKVKSIAILFCLLVGSIGNMSAQGFLDKVLKGMEKTNKVLDEADKMLGTDDGNRNQNNSEQRSGRSKRITRFQIVSPHPDLDIQFKRCAASASTVIIDLVITWYGDDANMHIGESGGDSSNNTLAYDDNGKKYSAYDYQIHTSIAGSKFEIGASALFPTDVPIKVRLEISNVSESVQEFKRLMIRVRGMNDPITFYNLPISRQTAKTVAPVESDGEPTGISELGNEESEEFSEFEQKFVTDSAFQISRVIFTDLGYISTEEESTKITKDNYSLHKVTLAEIAKDERYETKRELSKDKCVQKIWIDSSSFLLEYTYTKINGKWFLTKQNERY